jgi:hypothetical protein
MKMKLPADLIKMLEDHCEKLVNVEDALYQLAMQKDNKEDFLKTVELWMQAQSQLRITALEVQKQSSPTKK